MNWNVHLVKLSPNCIIVNSIFSLANWQKQCKICYFQLGENGYRLMPLGR